ncbi:DUF1837 domain-containing protein [Nitrososphaera sp.]|uniref:HamA C-terminal domain-containing protein n=1 Tax=Nitrososphaera sp. TaxID=1971748 RepID=UPI0017A5CC5E|nr:DUF1837 domain-containing protein [Nitrososphaera sp.]NWG36576.1 DUF1837 domain-containing protein [Nitrososphaera sp.]
MLEIELCQPDGRTPSLGAIPFICPLCGRIPRLSSTQIEEFSKYLEQMKRVWQADIENYLHSFPTKKPLPTLNCRFYLPTCTADKIREDDLIDFLVDSVVRYVTESKLLDPERMKDPAYSSRIYRRARDKFRQKDPKPSEVGELILFILLESEGIIQVVQKMPLKTNKNMPLHGADGIHVQVDNGMILLHFGESKMYKDLGGAISKSIDSVTDFTNGDGGKRKFELDIISTYIDKEKFGRYADVLAEIVLPYAKNKQKYREVNSIFIGYNWDVMCKLSSRDQLDLTAFLKSEFEKRHDEIAEKMQKAVLGSKIKDQHFHVQFMPFVDVDQFKAKFKKEL